MDFTYKETELEIARYIKLNSPRKIWWDFVTYTFDYGDFYFELVSEPKSASTQNKSDEAIIGQLTKHVGLFKPNDNSELVCDNKKIDEVYIVRVFLYFTTFRNYSKLEQVFNQTKHKLKTILSSKSDPVDALTAKATGGGMEYTCHPKSDEAKEVNVKYSNIIDCGLLLKIEDEYLPAFITSNAYGFHLWDNNIFTALKTLKMLRDNMSSSKSDKKVCC